MAAKDLDELIKDLLGYSRLSRSDIVIEAVDLQGLVERVLRDLHVTIRACGGTVTVRQPLPWVLGHQAMLVQTISKLVTNGLKCVAAGIAPQADLWAERLRGRVRVWVSDNGIGIAPEHYDRIFGVFQRLHGTEAYAGTGIGLAIVKKGVERLGGTVGLESEPRRGSRFWVELAEVRGDQ